MGTILAVYILVWPLITAAVLYIICRAFVRDWRAARRKAGQLV